MLGDGWQRLMYSSGDGDFLLFVISFSLFNISLIRSAAGGLNVGRSSFLHFFCSISSFLSVSSTPKCYTFILQMRPYNSLREKSFGQTDKLGQFRPEGRGNLSVWGPERFFSLLMPAKTITYGGVTLGS